MYKETIRVREIRITETIRTWTNEDDGPSSSGSTVSKHTSRIMEVAGIKALTADVKMRALATVK